MARILLNTFGSFGDVHPYLALALELQRRNHECVLATSEVYRQKITSAGLGFAQVRPDVGELLHQPDLIAKLWHPRKGTFYLLRDYLLPKIEQSFTDLDRAATGADLLITHAAAYAGPIVAAVRKLPWLSVALQPAIFFSTHDPSVIAAAPWTRHLNALGRWPSATMMKFADRETRRWAQPVFDLRARIGVENTSNPVMQGVFSPLGTLTLFSQHFAAPQPDWPPASLPTGFIFYDQPGLSPALQDFLAAGPPPLLFTLGSSAVTHPESFYTESAHAVRQLGHRAVMLGGKQTLPPSDLIHTEEYASYSALMPHVAAVIHQGGIGTVAQTLRAGKPMLVVPWAHDQPDNAHRLKRLDVARILTRDRYTASTAAKELKLLLANNTYQTRAATLAQSIQNEDGLTQACNRIEAALNG